MLWRKLTKTVEVYADGQTKQGNSHTFFPGHAYMTRTLPPPIFNQSRCSKEMSQVISAWQKGSCPAVMRAGVGWGRGRKCLKTRRNIYQKRHAEVPVAIVRADTLGALRAYRSHTLKPLGNAYCNLNEAFFWKQRSRISINLRLTNVTQKTRLHALMGAWCWRMLTAFI